MEQKDLESKLGKETLEALDKRYIRVSDNHLHDRNETNSIIAKKKKIADFYKSLDDEERLMLGVIMDLPEPNEEAVNFTRTFTSKENLYKDFEDLAEAKFEKIASRINNKVFERMGTAILRDSPFNIW